MNEVLSLISEIFGAARGTQVDARIPDKGNKQLTFGRLRVPLECTTRRNHFDPHARLLPHV